MIRPKETIDSRKRNKVRIIIKKKERRNEISDSLNMRESEVKREREPIKRKKENKERRNV